MNQAKKIATNLQRLIDIGYATLRAVNEEEPDLESVNHQLERRAKYIQELNKLTIRDSKLKEDEAKNLRGLFTRFNVLEEQINKGLNHLSREYKKALSGIDLHKKAKKSYHTAANTHKFLDTRVNG